MLPVHIKSYRLHVHHSGLLPCRPIGGIALTLEMGWGACLISSHIALSKVVVLLERKYCYSGTMWGMNSSQANCIGRVRLSNVLNRG